MKRNLFSAVTGLALIAAMNLGCKTSKSSQIQETRLQSRAAVTTAPQAQNPALTKLDGDMCVLHKWHTSLSADLSTLAQVPNLSPEERRRQGDALVAGLDEVNRIGDQLIQAYHASLIASRRQLDRSLEIDFAGFSLDDCERAFGVSTIYTERPYNCNPASNKSGAGAQSPGSGYAPYAAYDDVGISNDPYSNSSSAYSSTGAAAKGGISYATAYTNGMCDEIAGYQVTCSFLGRTNRSFGIADQFGCPWLVGSQRY